MKLTARDLAFEDAELILLWRNSPEVRMISRETSLIPATEHYDWVRNWLNDENRGFFWIYSEAGNDVGYVRFDATAVPKLFEISILIAENMRGRGLGKMMLEDSIKKFTSQCEGKFLRAVVRSSNTVSMRLFASVGFHQDKAFEDWIEFSLTLKEFR